jgi:predicted DNA repair protein MutK
VASGLLVLLDDVAAIAKAAAASLDDVAAQALKAGGKAAGVVIDDAAVTPKYVIGLSPAREIPIVWNIAKGSLKNKLVILMPALLLLGYLAPWSISPLLAVGGLFLCFEGYEKLDQMFRGFAHQSHAPTADTVVALNPEELEQLRTAGAIRTDFILSAEIMAIAYDVIRDERFATRLGVLVVVAIAITGGVYGFVGLILKADDLGLHLARHGTRGPLRSFGRMLIAAMPWLLVVLGYVGTAAMLWVGGGIVLHAFPRIHDVIHDNVAAIDLPSAGAWGVEAGISLITGIAIGFVVASIVAVAKAYFRKDRDISRSTSWRQG